ncbi:MAG: hypothetical protein WCW35_02775 [Bacteroidota bacterium]
MPKIILVLILTLSLFLQMNCKDEPPVKPTPTNPLQLTAEDVSCTEAWLKISLTESEVDRALTLKRNDSTIAIITITGKDTLLLDTLLLPNNTYTYTLVKDNWSATAHITTMDTTSHDWNWTVEQLGITQSYLHDVAIINDTLAYAVGEIYINDSTGKFDNTPYNLAKWNGKKWELERVVINHRGSIGVPILNGIFAFSPTDIWLVAGSPIHGDGKNWTYFDIRAILGKDSISVTKAWGSSSSDMYFVGWGGGIIYYNGTTWKKIESGTTAELNDVWGGSNKWLGDNVVLVTGMNGQLFNANKLLRIKNGVVDTLGLPIEYTKRGLLTSVWFNQYSPVYISGDWIFKFHGLAGWNSEEEKLSQSALGTYSIRGNNVNDIITSGTIGLIAHFNGVSWKMFNEVKLNYRDFHSVTIKENLAIAVGVEGTQFPVGIIAVGKRK